MKKIAVIISTFAGLFLFTATASADSPLTSTPFYFAYEDVSIVNEAGEKGVIDAEIADYLADENNPLDIKAAVINALSWDINGKTNAETYSNLIYNTSANELDIISMSGDQQFCFGYLMAMDDYFDTEGSLQYLKLAEENIPDSFTLSIVRALVESMDLEDGGWENHIQPILQNNSLKKDMRQEAVNIILDYMALYSEAEGLVISQDNLMIEKDGIQKVYLYGTLVWDDKTPYEIVKDSNIADSEIGIDEYGIYYLTIIGKEIGSSSVEVENSEGRNVVIDFNIIPKAAEAITDIPKTGASSYGFIFGICVVMSAYAILVMKTKGIKRP